MAASRQRKIEHFYSLVQGDARVLDVGVSKDIGQGGPHLNYFLKTFRLPPEHYTGLGVDDLSGLRSAYPQFRFVEYPGGRFPFADGEFTHSFSNAVIEHVGNDEQQLQFVNEMLRVSGTVYFTTPAKAFPVESHTDVLFLHWHQELFWWWCARRGQPWWNRQTLYLFSRRRLQALMQRSAAKRFELFTNTTLGMPMTYTVVCSR